MLRRLLAPYAGARGLDPRVRVVVAGSFLTLAARMSLMTFLGIVLSQERGIPLPLVGLGFLVENAARGVFALPLGALTDRVGRRPVLLASVLGVAAVLPFVLLVDTVGELLLWSFALGTMAAGMWPASAALLLDLVPPARRQTALALNYTAISVGYTLGVAPAGFLAARGFPHLVAASVLGYVLVAVLYAVTLRGPLPMEAREGPRRPLLRDALRAPRDAAFLALVVLAFVFPLGISLQSTVAPVYGAERGMGEELIGLVLSLNGVLIALLAIPVAARVEAAGPYRHLAASAVLVGACFLAIAAIPSPAWGILVGTVLFTLGELVFSSALPAAVAGLAPPGARGAYQGAWSMVFGVGVGSGLFLGGLLRDALGWTGAWVACGVLGLAVAVAWAWLWPRMRDVAAARANAAA